MIGMISPEMIPEKKIRTAEEILRSLTNSFRKKYTTEMVRGAMIVYAQQFDGYPNNLQAAALREELEQCKMELIAEKKVVAFLNTNIDAGISESNNLRTELANAVEEVERLKEMEQAHENLIEVMDVAIQNGWGKELREKARPIIHLIDLLKINLTPPDIQ